MEVTITDLTWVPAIYPRGGNNEKTVQAYVEALAIGAQFVMRFAIYSVCHVLCAAVEFLPREMPALWNSAMVDLLRRIPQRVHISEINPIS